MASGAVTPRAMWSPAMATVAAARVSSTRLAGLKPASVAQIRAGAGLHGRSCAQSSAARVCRRVLTDQMMNTSIAITTIDHHG